MQDEAYEGLEKFNQNREQRLRARLNAADDPREKYRLLKCIYTNRKSQLEPVDSEDGGPGSGHFRHRGRKGQKGGSIPYASTLSSEISSSYSSSKTSEGTVDTAKTKKTFTSVSKKAAVGSKITVYKPSTHSEMTYTKVDDDKYVSEAGTLCDITSIMQGVDFTSEEHVPYVHYVDKGTQKELYYNVSSSLPAYTASSATVYEAGDVEKLSTAEVGTSVFNYGTGTSLCKLGGDLYLDALNGQIMSAADVKKSLTKQTESASEESSAETSKAGTSGSTQETSENLKESSAAATASEGFMTSSDFELLYQSSALEAAKAVQSMSMTDAMRYFQYTGADANTLSELSNLYDAGNEGDFNSFVSQVMEAGMGSNFKNDAINAQQKLDYLKNVSEDPAAFLEKYGTSEEEASAAKKLKKADTMYEKGFITADEAEGLKTDALNACYQDQITLDQEKVTSELSKCSDMQSMLSSLNDMCPDIGSAASHLYDSGASDETITAAIANYYGMTASEFTAKLSSETQSSAQTAQEAAAENNSSGQTAQEQAAQSSSQSAQEQAAETGTQSSGKADWLMTDGGNFSCNGQTYNPSTADEISNSKYAITAEGEIYKNVNDGSGDFMNMETGELHSAQELADATSLGMSATMTAQFEAMKVQQESGDTSPAVKCTHIEKSDLPDTVLDTTTTKTDYINQQKKVLQIIQDTGMDYQEAKDAAAAVSAYSDGFYTEIRDLQANGENSKYYGNDTIQKYADDIEAYIEEAPKWTGAMLYRGVCASQSTFQKFMNCVKNGLDISQEGVSSWSSTEYVSMNFAINKISQKGRKAVLFVCKKGTKKGTTIKHMSNFQSEDEILVSSTARQRCTGNVYTTSYGHHKVTVIEVEEVE